MNAYGVISLVRLSRLAPSCGSFLPVLNLVIPGLRAGTCAVLRGSLLIVSVSASAFVICLIKNYFTLLFCLTHSILRYMYCRD